MRRPRPARGVRGSRCKAARWAALAAASAAFLVVAAPAAADPPAPPANNDFAAAQTLNNLAAFPDLPAGSPSGHATATNAYATLEAFEGSIPHAADVPEGRGFTVWFKWTAPTNRLTIFDTVGSHCLGGAALPGCMNGLLTILSVYTGPSMDELALTASNYKCPGATGGFASLQSCLSFNPVAGHTYYFQVDDRMNWVPGADEDGVDDVASVPWRGGIALNWRPVPTAPAFPPGGPSPDIGPDGVSHTTTPMFAFTGSDGEAFTCTTTNFPFVAYIDTNCGTQEPGTNIFKYQVPPLTDGGHTFTVVPRDPTTDIPGDPTTIDFTVVSTPPPDEPTLISAPTNPTNDTAATFGFSSDGATSFQCKLDTGDFQLCSSPFGYSGLGPGEHTFLVYAENAGGVSQTRSFTWNVVVLPSPPGAPILLSTPSNPTSSTSASFGFSSAGATSYTCSLDGGPTSPCDGGTINYTGPLSFSSHTFNVFAGNAGGTSSTTSYNWVILPPPPALPIFTSTPVPSPGDTTTSTDASFAFSSAGATSLMCALDTDLPTLCNDGARSYSTLGLGPHTFRVFGSNAGGTSGTNTFAWTIQARVEDSLPCNSVEGHAHGHQNFQTTFNGKKANVHVEVDGDCDYNKKTGQYFLHHSKVKVEISGAGVPGKLIDAKQNSNGKRSDISGMKLTTGPGAFPTATLNGMWQGIPFVVMLTDGGKGGKNSQDLLQVTYPGFPTEVLKAGHNDVHIEFH